MDESSSSESYLRASVTQYLDSMNHLDAEPRRKRAKRGSRLSVNRLLKITVVTAFYLYIFNMIFDSLLYLQIITPAYYIEFRESCPRQLHMAMFLDIFLTIASVMFFLYCISFVSDTELEPNNLPTYFFGYLLLWVGIKLSFFLLYLKNKRCLFLNIFDVFILLFPNVSMGFLLLYNACKVLFYVWIFWLLNEADKKKRRELISYLNDD